MHKLIIIILVFLVCQFPAYGRSSTDSLMRQLENVIAERDVYVDKKEVSLRQAQERVRLAPTDTDRFDALLHLFDQFYSYNTDSAYNVSTKLNLLALEIGDPDLIAHARMKRANILMSVSMFHEALELMDSVKYEYLPEYLHPYYFHLKRTLYGGLADFAAFGSEKTAYDRLTNAYRDSIMSVNTPGSLGYVLTQADYINSGGAPGEAVDLLKGYIAENELSEHDRAICAYILSESYSKLGDKASQKEQLLISAIYDLESATREYISLRKLALLLYEEGDLKRAYEFMTIALDDAAKCNSRQRIIELNDVFPQINGFYIETIQNQKKHLARTIAAIVVLLLMLIIVLFLMRRQMLKTGRAKKELEIAYSQLNQTSEQLRLSIENLNRANNDIAEISKLKEVYICQYMSRCIEYIDKLDAYRKTIAKLIRNGKIKDIERIVKSTTLADEEMKAFYDQFDKTFLDLFPAFIDELNGLLIPGERITLKREGCLNTELRVLALIRLGITDSEKIAAFLRCSVATIYTYRTRIRNKAKGERNRLEQEIGRIGRQQ